MNIFGVLNKDLIDKIGSVGGTIFLLYTVFEYAVSSYSRVSFRNRLLKRLYFARVNKPNKLFLKKRNKDFPNSGVKEYE